MDFRVDFRTKAQGNSREKALYGLLWLLWHELLLNTYCTDSFDTRCTDRNDNKVSSYPYEGAGKSSYGARRTDRNDNKVPSYPYEGAENNSFGLRCTDRNAEKV